MNAQVNIVTTKEQIESDTLIMQLATRFNNAKDRFIPRYAAMTLPTVERGMRSLPTKKQNQFIDQS